MLRKFLAAVAVFALVVLAPACGGETEGVSPAVVTQDAGPEPVAIQSAPLTTAWTQTRYTILPGEREHTFFDVGNATTQLCGIQDLGIAFDGAVGLGGPGFAFQNFNGQYELELDASDDGNLTTAIVGCTALTNFTSPLGHPLQFNFPKGRGVSIFNNNGFFVNTQEWWCESSGHEGYHDLDGADFVNGLGGPVESGWYITAGQTGFTPNTLETAVNCFNFSTATVHNYPQISARFTGAYNPNAQRGQDGGPCSIPNGGTTNTICNYANGFTELNSFCAFTSWGQDPSGLTFDTTFHESYIGQVGVGEAIALYTTAPNTDGTRYQLGNVMMCLPYVLN